MSEILMAFVVVVLAVIGVGGFMLLKPDRKEEEPEWHAEVAQGEPPSMEERILDILRKDSPKAFRILRFDSLEKLTEWDEFWETLKSLEAEGKVVRVANATETSDSLWALPTEEDDES